MSLRQPATPEFAGSRKNKSFRQRKSKRKLEGEGRVNLTVMRNQRPRYPDSWSKTIKDDLFLRAWETRKACFSSQVKMIYSQGTWPVSITGDTCQMDCAHCGGYYLRSMMPLERALGHKSTPLSYLLSGGCNPDGKVPHHEQLEKVRALSRRAPLNLHPGLVNTREIQPLAELVQVFSLDLVVDDTTVKEVYGSPWRAKDFMASYRALRLYSRVIPHLCIGLRGGIINGEHSALSFLQKEGAEAIIFLVLRPTPGARFASCNPPLPEEVARVIARARVMFPRTPLYLGCMRPGGNYRARVDSLALAAGINRLVQPHPSALEAAKQLGLELLQGEECCAF